ncbi:MULTISPECIES: TonB-dependent receptor domain-containing protein [Rodentibacter]|uniref:TonB-dependent receptor domain-containing protein n=1 Tax=Rodentibacter TaxID=1960084 RepID=UPI001CFD33E5|nr:TonB-dependent receptor [Rodentibacter sp. JRC1]GJI55762.1 putative TonB-dependent receptor [Rodentibacter sp. JRC1]
MKNIQKTIHYSTLLALLLFNFASAEDEKPLQLEQINVEAKNTETSNYKIFKQPTASSSKEQVYKSTTTIDETIRSMPGAFTQQDKSSGIVSLNIRGDSGFGRVNSMVDGVAQTFYASATDGNNRSGGSSQFGAVLDPNFIAGIDLTKGTFDGKSGGNSLSGSANFRTLGVNDVVKVGDKFGILTKGTIGNNQSKYDYMATAAYRQELNNGGYLGILYGASKREVSQNYKVGGGKRITELGVDILNRLKREDFLFGGLKETPDGRWVDTPEEETKCLRKWGKSCGERAEDVWNETSGQYDTTPFDANALRQKSQSHLAKIEYVDNYNILNLQYRIFNNMIAGRKIENKTYQLNYNFSSGDLIDLSLLYSHNSGKQKYPKGSLFSGKEVKEYLQANNTSDTLDINNHFSFFLPKNTKYDLTLGANLFINKYSKNRFPEEFGLFYGQSFFGPKDILPRTSSIFQPSGKQKFTTFYIDNRFTKDIFNLNYSVNFVDYRFNGEYAGYFSEYKDYIKHYSQDEILRRFCNKDEDLEGENGYACELHEPIMKKGGKRNAINHSLALNVDIHELFNPFISYSKTHRMPNIQEMYFSQIGNVGVNTNLKPEQAQTYQIGFNSAKEGVISDNDRLGLKLVFYRSKIKNYIHNVYSFWGGEQPEWSHLNGYLYTVHFQNYRFPVRKKGLELELSYDNGRFFTNLSYAYQKSNQPTNFSDAGPDNIDNEDLEQIYGLSKISTLPRDYGRLELGTRWFDQRLTLATVARYYGKSKRATLEHDYIYGMDHLHGINNVRTKKTEEIAKQPIIFDFYVSYEPIKDLIIKAELINAFDKRYIDPLDSSNDAASQRYYLMELGDLAVMNNFARGRTAKISLSYQF